MKIYICEECGKEYHRDDYIIRTRFCSRVCQILHQQKNKIITRNARIRLKEITISKVCSVCHINQPIQNFTQSIANKDGYSTRCKQCAININAESRTKKSEYLQQFKSVPKKDRISARRYHDSTIIKRTLSRENKINGGNMLSYDDWLSVLKTQNNRCAVCGNEFSGSNPPTRDHIISISWGGSFTKENVQALCGHCNSKKGTRCYSGLIRSREGGVS